MASADGWRRVKFGDVVRTVSESIADPVAAGIDRAVGLEHLEPRQLALTNWTSTGDGLTFTRRFRAGQVLFGRRRAYQRKVCVPEFDGVCSGDIYVFEPSDEQLLPDLLPFIVQNEPFFEYALRTSAGSLSPRTKWTDLKNYEFELPSIEQQREISKVLWAAELLMRRLTLLHEMSDCAVAAARDEMFVNGDWVTPCLEDVCVIPSQNGLTKVKKSRSGPARMVNMGQIFGVEEVDVDDCERVELGPNERRSHLLEEGDLLFARRSIVLAGAGKCSIVPAFAGDLTFESSIVRVRVDPEQLNPRFLLHYFRSRVGCAAMRRIVRAGPVAGIAGSDLRRMRVPRPTLDEQDRVVERVETLRNSLPVIQRQLKRTRELKVALLEEVLGGGSTVH